MHLILFIIHLQLQYIILFTLLFIILSTKRTKYQQIIFFYKLNQTTKPSQDTGGGSSNTGTACPQWGLSARVRRVKAGKGEEEGGGGRGGSGTLTQINSVDCTHPVHNIMNRFYPPPVLFQYPLAAVALVARKRAEVTKPMYTAHQSQC